MLETARVLQDRYRLDRALGKAAGRQTWLATDLTCQETVVVKLLTFSDQVQWDNLRLFEREAAILKQLDHPRIPQYRDYFCIDDRLLWFGLVQQYIPGISLKDLLTQRGAITTEQAQDVAVSILAILTYLHGLSPPVLHRDIKPSNIILGEDKLGEDKQIYLVDFGAVQDRAAAAGATFTVVGTYGYAPLEQFGGRASPASDLYALGATLIHLLTDIAPVNLPQYDGRMQFADQVSLHPGFVRWLKRLTEPNLERRFRTAEQALEKLNTIQMSGAIARSQPPNSRIKLTKSSQQLEVKLLPPWSGAIDVKKIGPAIGLLSLVWLLLGNGGMAGLLQVLLLSPPFVLVIALISLPSFITAEAHFNYQRFEIRWKLLGLCLYRQQGDIDSIDRVFSGSVRGYGKLLPAISLGVGIRQYTFVALEPALSKAECNWLVDEIADWLGL
jgi:serine/threonine protein kinase